jgi:putative transposase
LIQRGHNRQPCFLHRWDYLVYLDQLREYSHAHGAMVHAYVLMTNHVHLLISFDEIRQLPRFMKALAQKYAQYLNRRLSRCGSVWQGRYRSSAVTDDSYFLSCQRYIELNPVRAAMTESPAAYRWSSYAGNAGLLVDDLLTPHPTYLGISADSGRRHVAYRRLFTAPISQAHLAAIRHAARTNGPICGS